MIGPRASMIGPRVNAVDKGGRKIAPRMNTINLP
jgi:hypothetical protein